MSGINKKYLPSFISLTALSIIFIIVLNQILINNNNHFVYPVDDTYIHLTIARNIAETSVPGINPGEFAYLTSSPLWTLILSGAYAIGFHSELVPLIINLLLSIIFIFHLNRFLNNYIDNKQQQTVYLFLILIVTSLLHLIFIGMEHLLHTFLSFLFIIEIIKLSTKSDDNVNNFYLSIITILLTFARFESIFLLITAIVFMLINRKFKIAIILLLSSVIPLLMVGLYSISNGWYFLPSSLLLKSRIGDSSDFFSFIENLFGGFASNIFHNEFLIVMLLISFFFLFDKWKEIFLRKELSGLAIVFVITLFHAFFAKFGWFFRYEAYLVFIWLVFISINIFNEIGKFSKVKLLILSGSIIVLMMPIFSRAFNSNTNIALASNNIYSQQWNMSEFLRKNYSGETIAINDIGVISYRSNVRIIDLWGLGTKEIAGLKINKNKLEFDIGIEDILNRNNVKVAIIYSEWFRSDMYFPGNWLEAGSWKLNDNFVCGEDKVVFFAKDSTEYKKLVTNLIEYSGYIDTKVEQKIKGRK